MPASQPAALKPAAWLQLDTAPQAAGWQEGPALQVECITVAAALAPAESRRARAQGFYSHE